MNLQRGLIGYAVGVSAALLFVVLLGAGKPPANQEEITVRRINLLEPDGSVCMVIAGAQKAPGL